MSYKIKTIKIFDKQIKYLSKRHQSIKIDLSRLIKELENYPLLGTPLGKNYYKIRLSISSKSKGKSGGARIITSFVILDETVYLLSIYDKSEKEDLAPNELDDLLKHIND